MKHTPEVNSLLPQQCEMCTANTFIANRRVLEELQIDNTWISYKARILDYNSHNSSNSNTNQPQPQPDLARVIWRGRFGEQDVPLPGDKGASQREGPRRLRRGQGTPSTLHHPTRV